MKENEPIRHPYMPKSELLGKGVPKIVETWVVHEENSRYMPDTVTNGVDGLQMHSGKSKISC